MSDMLRRLVGLLAAIMMLCCLLPAQAADPIPEPTLSPDANPYDKEHPELLEEEQLFAASAILIEANTGNVIFEKNADQVMYPASTTKILTALLAIMFGDLNETVTVSEEAVTFYEDNVSNIDLRAGEEMGMMDLLYGTLLESGNDAANAIAEAISGSISRFVDLMNDAVDVFGCTSTHFANPHGLHDDNHYTTVRDMAIITREAMKNDLFRQIVSTSSYTSSRTNLMRARTWNTTNQLMIPGPDDKPNKYYYPYAIGVKTGNHSRAGYCFVGAAEKDGVELISVLFFTSRAGRWTDTIKLMDYGFSQYVSVTPIDLYNMKPIKIETTNYSLKDPAMGQLELTCMPVDPNVFATITATHDEVDMMANNLKDTVLIEYTRDFVAPIQAGEIMGTMTYVPPQGVPVEYNLLASRSIAKRENAPKTLEEIVDETAADPNPFPPFTFEIALYILLPTAAMLLLIKLLRKAFRRRRTRNARTPKPTSRYLK